MWRYTQRETMSSPSLLLPSLLPLSTYVPFCSTTYRPTYHIYLLSSLPFSSLNTSLPPLSLPTFLPLSLPTFLPPSLPPFASFFTYLFIELIKQLRMKIRLRVERFGHQINLSQQLFQGWTTHWFVGKGARGSWIEAWTCCLDELHVFVLSPNVIEKDVPEFTSVL